MTHRTIKFKTNRLTERNAVTAIEEAAAKSTGVAGLTVAAGPEEDEQKTADPPKKAR